MCTEYPRNSGFEELQYNTRNDIDRCKAFEHKAVYIIMKGERLAGRLYVSYSDCSALINIQDYEGGQAHQSRVAGSGFDRITAALEGYNFGFNDLFIVNKGTSFQDQLQRAGYNVIQAI